MSDGSIKSADLFKIPDDVKVRLFTVRANIRPGIPVSAKAFIQLINSSVKILDANAKKAGATGRDAIEWCMYDMALAGDCCTFTFFASHKAGRKKAIAKAKADEAKKDRVLSRDAEGKWHRETPIDHAATQGANA